MTTKATITSDEVEAYATQLRSFGDGLTDKREKLQQQLQRLGEGWQDRDVEHFEQLVDEASRLITGLADSAGELAQSLDSRVERARQIEATKAG